MIVSGSTGAMEGCTQMDRLTFCVLEVARVKKRVMGCACSLRMTGTRAVGG